MFKMFCEFDIKIKGSLRDRLNASQTVFKNSLYFWKYKGSRNGFSWKWMLLNPFPAHKHPLQEKIFRKTIIFPKL